MCRILAFASGCDWTVRDLLEPDELSGFKSLSRLHGDGWGTAFAPAVNAPGAGEGGLTSHRSVQRAMNDPAFDALAFDVPARAGLVHLRWATDGLAVAEENTHPFLFGGWAFAHNGMIPRHQRLDGLLSATWRRRRRGSTDSERYFLYVLESISRNGDTISGVRTAVADVRAIAAQGSLNAVLLGPDYLVAVHGRAGTPEPREDLLAAVEHPGDLPADHLDGYYGLRWLRRGDAVIVASSGLPGTGWNALPEDSMLVVERQTLAADVYLLDGSDSSDGGSPACVAGTGWP